MLLKKQKIENFITIHNGISLLIIILALYAILPMLILGDKYIFTIHDSLDNVAGYVEYIHKNGIFFNLFNEIPLIGGIKGYYLISHLDYGISGFLGALFGYITSQKIIRILGVVIGYNSMMFLYHQAFPRIKKTTVEILRFSSILYSITPCSTTRTLSFAVLPFIIGFFIYLSRQESFTKKSLLVFLFPFFSFFNATTLFCIIFWFCAGLIVCIKQKKINYNCLVSWCVYIFSTIIVDLPIIIIGFKGSETNRALHFPPSGFNKHGLLEVFYSGQYHTTSFHQYIFLICVSLGIIYCLYKRFLIGEDDNRYGRCALVLLIGNTAWGIFGIIETAASASIRTGILLIDGFQWGRLLEWGRLIWLFLFIELFVTVFEDDSLEINNKTVDNFGKQSLLSFLSIFVIFCVFLFFFDFVGFPNRFDSYITNGTFISIINLFKWIAIGFFAFSMFCGIKKSFLGFTFILLVFQVFFVLSYNAFYTDTTKSVKYAITQVKNDDSITIGEFFDTKLFEHIKEDIGYSGEGVAAYGFHPSVLMYNNFNTIDGYFSVHPMKNQILFREIISPALDRYPNWQSYYDNWGGRMYLFGDVGFGATRNKDVNPSDLFINTEAYKNAGGKYILSRVPIANADSLRLKLIKEYDREDSIYHIHLYKVDF